MVGLEEDRTFGDMERLVGMCEGEELTLMWQRCSLALVETMKKEMMEGSEFDLNGNQVEVQWEDVNAGLRQQIVSMTEMVLMLGSRGVVPWDEVLDWSENRWRLQDIRDEVSV